MNDRNNIPKYSFSSVNNFKECPLSYFMNKIEKDTDKLGNGASEFGVFVHNILEKYEKHELEIYELLDYYKNNYNNNVKSDFNLILDNDFTKDLSDIYYKSGEEYFKNFNGFEKFSDYDIVETEYEFEELIGERYIFVGKVDLLLRNKDNFILIDHKSKSGFKNKVEREEYKRQLYLYSYAVSKKYNKFPNIIGFNMFRKNKWKLFDFNIDEYIDTLKWFNDLIHEIEDCKSFYPVPNTFYCKNFCCYRHKCPYK